jgi:hypothetical protein
MNGKPKSYRAMLLAVAAANHPELDAGDKALLNVLAINADASTGGGSRPGNAALMVGTALRWSACHARLEKNIQRGLIECTYKATSRHMASVYRLCLDNPAYPNRMPNGEWLIENPPPEPGAGSSSGDKSTVRPEPDSNGNLPSGPSRTVNESTVRPEGAYHPANPVLPSGESVLPSGESALPSGLSRMTSKYTSKDVSKNQPTHHPPEKEKKLPSGASRKGGGVEGWILKNLATMGTPKGKHREALNQFVAQHGDDVVTTALNQFLNRPDGFGGVKIPWALFISEADMLIGQLKQAASEKEANDLANMRAGERLKAKLLPQFESLEPPLTESERKELDQVLQWEGEILTQPAPNDDWKRGVEYYIFWQCQRDRLDYWQRSRIQKKVDENGESVEELLKYLEEQP